MKRILSSLTFKLAAAGVLAASLAACGGGGVDVVGSVASVNGTFARGAGLAGSITLSCANGTTVTATSQADGIYAAPQTTISYPCAGTATATSGVPVYRGVMFSGNVANFTPLTDLLVEVLLAASSNGATSLTLAQFIQQIQTNGTFAASVSNSDRQTAYRAAVIATIRAKLIALGRTEAQADAILAAAANTAFESTAFRADGTGLDKVLEDAAFAIQGPNGSVLADVRAAAKVRGDTLPPPAGAPTGGSGT